MLQWFVPPTATQLVNASCTRTFLFRTPAFTRQSKVKEVIGDQVLLVAFTVDDPLSLKRSFDLKEVYPQFLELVQEALFEKAVSAADWESSKPKMEAFARLYFKFFEEVRICVCVCVFNIYYFCV